MSEVKTQVLSKLKNWGDNYRHGDIPAIQLSIETFGFNSPVAVAGDVVYVGNQRLAALKGLFSANPNNPPYGIKRRGNDWVVPIVDISHLNAQELKAYAIADNRTHDRGADDEPQLAKLLSDLAGDPALELATGYTESDILSLLESLAGPTPKEPKAPNLSVLEHEGEVVTCPTCGEEFKP